MTTDVEHFSVCLFSIHRSSCVKCLFKLESIKPIFVFVLGCFLLLSLESSLGMVTSSLSDMSFANIFSQSFHFLNSVFKEQTFLILMKLNLSIFFSFMVCAVVLSNLCLTIVLKEFLLCYFFFPENFTVLYFTFRCLPNTFLSYLST